MVKDVCGDTIGHTLIQTMRAHHKLAEKLLGELGLHVGQEFVLMQLYAEEGVSQSQLAELMGVEPPTVTKMLNRMHEFVERRPDPDDARVSRVYLTERGRALEQPVMRAWQTLEAQTVAGLNTTEQVLLRRLLQQIQDSLR